MVLGCAWNSIEECKLVNGKGRICTKCGTEALYPLCVSSIYKKSYVMYTCEYSNEQCLRPPMLLVIFYLFLPRHLSFHFTLAKKENAEFMVSG